MRIEHGSPAVHAAPADFALGSETLAMIFGNVAGFAESLSDGLGVANGILGPVGEARR